MIGALCETAGRKDSSRCASALGMVNHPGGSNEGYTLLARLRACRDLQCGVDRWRAAAICGVLFAGVTACVADHARSLVAPPPRSALAAVTSGIRINGDGTVQTAGPIQTQAPQITLAQAQTIARAWASEWIPEIRRVLEEQHHGPVNYPLVPCGRSYYAAPFAQEPSPATTRPDLHRLVGPWWIIPLCQTPAGAPEVSLAVNAFATDLRVVHGRLRYPLTPFQGPWFIPLGIPPEWQGQPVMISPENALLQLSVFAGRRAISPPELVYFPKMFPQAGQWHVALDSAVSVRTNALALPRLVQDVYIGISPRLSRHPLVRVAHSSASIGGSDSVVIRGAARRGRPPVPPLILRPRAGLASSLDTVAMSSGAHP